MRKCANDAGSGRICGLFTLKIVRRIFESRGLRGFLDVCDGRLLNVGEQMLMAVPMPIDSGHADAVLPGDHLR